MTENVVLYLFLPADRPDRFAKALGAGADAVILDLEDAVASYAKNMARQALFVAEAVIASAACPVFLRLNGVASPHHAEDLRVASAIPFAGVMLAKAETAGAVRSVAGETGRPVIALIESALGLAEARAIATASARLAFGSVDLAADLGCAHTRAALQSARSELVLASRLAEVPSPIDGVTTTIGDATLVESDAAYGASHGFGAKLLIHPAQIEPARRGFAPSAEDIAWATRVLAQAPATGAAAVGGMMVDRPVRLRAERTLRLASRVTAARESNDGSQGL